MVCGVIAAGSLAMSSAAVSPAVGLRPPTTKAVPCRSLCRGFANLRAQP